MTTYNKCPLCGAFPVNDLFVAKRSVFWREREYEIPRAQASILRKLVSNPEKLVANELLHHKRSTLRVQIYNLKRTIEWMQLPYSILAKDDGYMLVKNDDATHPAEHS